VKPFVLFKGSNYYPSGGWDDNEGSFDTLEEAVAAAMPVEYLEWAHVVDVRSGAKVWSLEGPE